MKINWKAIYVWAFHAFLDLWLDCVKDKIGISGPTPRTAAMVLSILKQIPRQGKILTICYYCIILCFFTQKTALPDKNRNLFNSEAWFSGAELQKGAIHPF